jgi:uncharacterized lipoprotein YmbA
MKPIRLCLLALAAASLTGCGNIIPAPQTDPTRFYVLASPSQPESATLSTSGRLRLGLRKVDVASYLEGREIVVRSGNELTLEEYARWAEPLASSVGRILRTQLELDPSVARVDYETGGEFEHEYNISIEVLHCEGAAVGSRHVARFAALFRITEGALTDKVVARRIYIAPDAPWDGHDFSQLAALLSQDVAALAKEIISALPQSSPGPS